ncbi:MAG TPA: hypothetical protein VLK65_19250 [Vicinamibacteria bacterium]|nr:hypothetical protein [Vicinamibacteria bacterium]
MYTEFQKADFKTRFAKKRRSQIVLAILVVAVLVTLVISEKQGAVLDIPYSVAGPVGAALMVGGAAFSIFNWRCPACSKYLGKRLNPKFCATCGIELT